MAAAKDCSIKIQEDDSQSTGLAERTKYSGRGEGVVAVAQQEWKRKRRSGAKGIRGAGSGCRRRRVHHNEVVVGDAGVGRNQTSDDTETRSWWAGGARGEGGEMGRAGSACERVDRRGDGRAQQGRGVSKGKLNGMAETCLGRLHHRCQFSVALDAASAGFSCQFCVSCPHQTQFKRLDGRVVHAARHDPLVVWERGPISPLVGS